MIPYKLTKTLDPLRRYSQLTEEDLSEFYQRKKEVFTFENLGGNIWELHGRYVVQYCQTSAIFEYFIDDLDEAISDLLQFARFYGKDKITKNDIDRINSLRSKKV